MNQKVSVRLILLMVLALIGLGCSIALSQHFYDLRAGAAGFNSYCNIGSKINCDAVAASTWAEVLPGLPISSIAAGWYAGLFFIFLTASGFTVRREALKIALILGGFGAAVSAVYLLVMIFQIGTYCLLCLGLDAINFVSFGIIWSLRPKGGSQVVGYPHWKGFAGIMTVCLFVAVVGLKGLDRLTDRSETINDQVQTIFAREPIAVSSSPDDLSIGPANAPITLVEFSDFQCPFCRIGAFTLHAVMSRFPDQVRIVMKPYAFDPSCNRFVDHPMHAVACEAARAAVCAGVQGKFEPVYEAFFQNQESLGPGKVLPFAQQAGVDMARLQSCMSDNQSLAKVQASIEEANRLGVNATPTFFINGYRVEGITSLPLWTEVIKRLLVAAQSSHQ